MRLRTLGWRLASLERKAFNPCFLHTAIGDTPLGIPGNPHPRAKLSMAEISQGFQHSQRWQNY